MRLILGYRIPDPHTKPTCAPGIRQERMGTVRALPDSLHLQDAVSSLSLGSHHASGPLEQARVMMHVSCPSWQLDPLPTCTTRQTSCQSILIGGSFFYVVMTAIQLIWRHGIFTAGSEDLAIRNTKNYSGLELPSGESIHHWYPW